MVVQEHPSFEFEKGSPYFCFWNHFRGTYEVKTSVQYSYFIRVKGEIPHIMNVIYWCLFCDCPMQVFLHCIFAVFVFFA